MFGTNPIAKQVEGDGQWLEVQSIFSTIQGEGPFAGKPAIFLRLAGCNLRCYFCDTDFESRRTSMTIGEIRVRIQKLASEGKYRSTNLVVVTGGEPLLQNVVPLTRALKDLGFHVQFETAGTVWPGWLESLVAYGGEVSLVCSPKTGKVHPMVERYCYHWKYLIREGEVSSSDGLPVMSTQVVGKRQPVSRPPRGSDTVWLQPCEMYTVNYRLDPVRSAGKSLENLELADQEVTEAVRDEEATQRNIRLCAELAIKYNYRVSLQLHKLLHLP